MRHQNDWGKMILVFFLSLLFIFTGCQGTRIIIESGSTPDTSPDYKKGGPPPWAPAHGYRAKYRYRYYPAHHVYCDERRGVQFYYRDGAWHVSVSLPIDIRIDINDYVTLEMDTDKPYEFHDEVVKRYPPGQLKKKDKKKGKDKWK